MRTSHDYFPANAFTHEVCVKQSTTYLQEAHGVATADAGNVIIFYATQLQAEMTPRVVSCAPYLIVATADGEIFRSWEAEAHVIRMLDDGRWRPLARYVVPTSFTACTPPERWAKIRFPIFWAKCTNWRSAWATSLFLSATSR